MNYSYVSQIERHDKKVKKRRAFRRITIAMVAMLLFVAAWRYWRSMMPVAMNIATATVNAEATRIINQVVCDEFCAVAPSELITTVTDDDSQVVMIQANTAFANTLSRQVALSIQSKIDDMVSHDIHIPLGTLSGVVLLAEKGPSFTVELSPIGSVRCNLQSVFESAGVNQTLHRIYATIICDVSVIIRSYKQTVTTETSVLLLESLVVGKVPSTYLNGGIKLNESK